MPRSNVFLRAIEQSVLQVRIYTFELCNGFQASNAFQSDLYRIYTFELCVVADVFFPRPFYKTICLCAIMWCAGYRAWATAHQKFPQ